MTDATVPAGQRLLIRLLERLSGQHYLQMIYERYRKGPRESGRFFDDCMRLLGVQLDLAPDTLARAAAQWRRGG